MRLYFLDFPKCLKYLEYSCARLLVVDGDRPRALTQTCLLGLRCNLASDVPVVTGRERFSVVRPSKTLLLAPRTAFIQRKRRLSSSSVEANKTG